MSELMNVNIGGDRIRRNLLIHVSALTLWCSAWGPTGALASAEEYRPTVWIELGGQLERVDGGETRYTPPFASTIDTAVFASPLAVQKPPRYATGGEGKVTFQPEGAHWTFSASVRYGRSNGGRHSHQETKPGSGELFYSIPAFGYYKTQSVPPLAKKFVDASSHYEESHAVVDFQAGKDIGLGSFGAGSTSVFNVGVRFAQFTSKSSMTLNADPDFQFSNKYLTSVFGIHGKINVPLQKWHLFASREDVTQSFHGIGPSLAWDVSTPLIGESQAGELTFDWGVNAAVLFGRQKVRSHHETTGSYRSKGVVGNTVVPVITYQPGPHNVTRSRTVTVPNVGGFTGVSLKFPNAKISLGYRADFFFGAVDGGIDTAKSFGRNFYGPFATISIGLDG